MSLLSGIRVIDAASFVAGPAAATVLADFGADVIKIEPPGRGDTYRDRSAPDHPGSDVNYSWLLDNRNKRSLAVNLKEAAGREVLYALIKQADVFVSNLPLAARKRMLVRWDDLQPLNDRLIYASISAYGESGPDAERSGFDSTALWARSSLMHMVRPSPDAAPARSLPGMGDHPTAVSLFAGIMAALYQRERTGKGDYVTTSLMANGVWWNSIQVQAMLCGAEYTQRPAREDAANALQNLYQAADSRWFQLACTPEEKRWPSLLQVLDAPELNRDPKFATTTARHANAKALIETLDRLFSSKPWHEWQAALAAADVAAGAVQTLPDVVADPQMFASDTLTPISDATAGAKHVVNSPMWLRNAPKVEPAVAPALGQHSDEILREAGYNDSTISKLRERGVIE
jgi:crotonobetainyl-CoA:carnitine CoA-transferase CaiB-like acyl-CoA transferase